MYVRVLEVIKHLLPKDLLNFQINVKHLVPVISFINRDSDFMDTVHADSELIEQNEVVLIHCL